MSWKRFGPLSKKEIAEAVREGKRRARFLIDESVDVEVAHLILQSGWNAIHVEECGLKGHPDENVLAFAQRENRILITHDPDFLDDRRFPPSQNPGLFVIPGAEGDRRAIVSALDAVLRIVGNNRDLWSRTKIRVSADGTWTVLTFDKDVGRIAIHKYRFRRGRPIEYWDDST